MILSLLLLLGSANPRSTTSANVLMRHVRQTDTPEMVTEQFIRGMMKGDKSVYRLMTRKGAVAMEKAPFADQKQAGTFKLEKPKIIPQGATIIAIMKTQGDDQRIRFRLVKEEGAWRLRGMALLSLGDKALFEIDFEEPDKVGGEMGGAMQKEFEQGIDGEFRFNFPARAPAEAIDLARLQKLWKTQRPAVYSGPDKPIASASMGPFVLSVVGLNEYPAYAVAVVKIKVTADRIPDSLKRALTEDSEVLKVVRVVGTGGKSLLGDDRGNNIPGIGLSIVEAPFEVSRHIPLTGMLRGVTAIESLEVALRSQVPTVVATAKLPQLEIGNSTLLGKIKLVVAGVERRPQLLVRVLLESSDTAQLSKLHDEMKLVALDAEGKPIESSSMDATRVGRQGYRNYVIKGIPKRLLWESAGQKAELADPKQGDRFMLGGVQASLRKVTQDAATTVKLAATGDGAAEVQYAARDAKGHPVYLSDSTELKGEQSIVTLSAEMAFSTIQAVRVQKRELFTVPLRISHIPLRQFAKSPVALAPIKFAGPTPLRFDYKGSSGPPNDRQATFSVTNLTGKGVFSLELAVQCIGAGGEVLSEIQSTQGAAAAPIGQMKMLLDARKTGEMKFSTFEQPAATRTVRVVIRRVVFGDRTVWRTK